MRDGAPDRVVHLPPLTDTTPTVTTQPRFESATHELKASVAHDIQGMDEDEQALNLILYRIDKVSDTCEGVPRCSDDQC